MRSVAAASYCVRLRTKGRVGLAPMSNGAPWTAADESNLRRLVKAGLHDGLIGERLGRDRAMICRKRNALELAPGQSQAMTAALRRIRARRKAERATMSQLVSETGPRECGGDRRRSTTLTS